MMGDISWYLKFAYWSYRSFHVRAIHKRQTQSTSLASICFISSSIAFSRFDCSSRCVAGCVWLCEAWSSSVTSANQYQILSDHVLLMQFETLTLPPFCPAVWTFPFSTNQEWLYLTRSTVQFQPHQGGRGEAHHLRLFWSPCDMSCCMEWSNGSNMQKVLTVLGIPIFPVALNRVKSRTWTRK